MASDVITAVASAEWTKACSVRGIVAALVGAPRRDNRLPGEDTHGSVRISLAAVPRRGVFYAAGLAVVTAANLPAAGLVAGFGALLVGHPLPGEHGVGLDGQVTRFLWRRRRRGRWSEG
ncbi:hypothetical protein ABZ746_09385 [Streptomyces sp. NPDC020096]